MKRPRILVFNHSDEAPAGLVEEWLLENGLEYKSCSITDDFTFPDLADFDGLILLGGPMNVDQYEEHTWLPREKKFLKAAIDAEKKIVGICLGAQLLACALGAKVSKNEHKEIGWYVVEREDALSLGVQRHFTNWPQKLRVFQYHEDRFEIPAGARRLFHNPACDNQGFSFQNHVIGLQFHPEATPAWVKDCEAEIRLEKGLYVQKTSDVDRYTFESSLLARGTFFSFLDSFFEIHSPR